MREMTVGVLDKIIDLGGAFQPLRLSQTQGVGPSIELEQPLLAAFHRWLRIQRATVSDEVARSAQRNYEGVSHYYDNLLALLSFIVDSIDEGFRDNTRRPLIGNRLRLDVEKLLSDTRSLLDELYRLILLYQRGDEVEQISKGEKSKRRTSFGVFAEWFAVNPQTNFHPPLSFLCELVPWGLTIRKLRTNYVHLAHEGMVIFSDTEVYFDTNWPRRFRGGSVRNLPFELYANDNQTLIHLDKLITYIIAPIVSLNQALGDYLNSLVVQSLPSSALVSSALYRIIGGNPDILDPEIYQWKAPKREQSG